MLLVTAISVLLLLVLSGIVTSAVQTISQTSRSVQNHDASIRLLGHLQDDLRDLIPLDDLGLSSFTLESAEGSTVLTIVRSEPRISDVNRQGYYRHVEYAWHAEERALVRTAFHSADHPDAAGALSSDARSTDHASNALRLASLTPALDSSKSSGWTDDSRVGNAREIAKQTPIFTDLDDFVVECLNGDDLKSVSTHWDDPQTLPRAVRIRLEARSNRTQKTPRRFEFLIPVETRPLPSS